MIKHFYLPFLLLFGLFTSCHTVKHASKFPDLQPLNERNFELLKGEWKNQPIHDQLDKSYASTYNANTLHKVQLSDQFFILDKDFKVNAQKVKLLLQNNNLQVIAMNDDTIVSEFDIKGKYRKGYFKTKKESKTRFPPIPLFFYFNENVRLFITVDKANNLVVKRRGANSGSLFHFANSFSMDNEYHFAPINSKTNQ